jgi:hypothetical protein
MEDEAETKKISDTNILKSLKQRSSEDKLEERSISARDMS